MNIKKRLPVAVSLMVLILASFSNLVCSRGGAAASDRHYQLKDNAILCDGRPVTLRGVNAMHIFNDDSSDLLAWPGIGIVREFVGDLLHAPLKPGETYRDDNHHWTLRPLQTLVDNNRKHGIVTIVCPFGWDSSATTEFTGSSPRNAFWYSGYKAKMREWVAQFKGQSDVWIELMNEPFHPCKTPDDDSLWLATMIDMVDNLRSAGWDGIIVVPGSGWGQDETVIERMGPQLLKGRHNLLFDVHIYDSWLNHPNTISERCAKVRASKLPFIFAELGPGAHDQHVCDAQPFIEAARDNDFSVLAWGWGTFGPRHPINLQTNDGSPNDVNNFKWGSTFKSFLAAGSRAKATSTNSTNTSDAYSYHAQAAPPQAQAVNSYLGAANSSIADARQITIVEAETASTSKNCNVSDRPAAFCGSGTMQFSLEPGFAQWSLNEPVPGHYLAVLKYCNQGANDQLAKLKVNGKEYEVSFSSVTAHLPETLPSWYQEVAKSNWQFVGVPVELSPGKNVVSLATQPADGQLYLDNLSFTQDNNPAPAEPIFDVKARGAKGDGSTTDTIALQKAIDACAGTGGTVLLRNGKFLSGQLQLKSKMTFWVDKTAELLASKTADYRSDSSGQNTAFVLADGVTNLAVTGGGAIDGQGEPDLWKNKPDQQRPILLELANARNTSINNLNLRNSAFWTLVLKDSETIYVNAVNIASLTHPNRDGIDPCDSHHVTIMNCAILSDDDSLCPKSSTSRGVRDLFVKNVSLTSGANGIKFGTASYGCFDNCRFKDVTITRAGTGISIGISDGAEVRNATFKDIRMGSVFVPISVLQGAGLRTNWPHYDHPKPLNAAGRVSDILLEDIHASARKQFASCISGVEKNGETYRVENVTLRRVNIENGLGYGGTSAPGDPKEYAGEYPDYGWMKFVQLPPYGLYVRHAKNVKIEDCQFTARAPDSRQPVVMQDVVP